MGFDLFTKPWDVQREHLKIWHLGFPFFFKGPNSDSSWIKKKFVTFGGFFWAIVHVSGSLLINIYREQLVLRWAMWHLDISFVCASGMLWLLEWSTNKIQWRGDISCYIHLGHWGMYIFHSLFSFFAPLYTQTDYWWMQCSIVICFWFIF